MQLSARRLNREHQGTSFHVRMLTTHKKSTVRKLTTHNIALVFAVAATVLDSKTQK